MAEQDAFRDALEQGDVSLLRRMWSAFMPHLPQPKNDLEAEVVMHHARSQTETISLKARAYSHRWLTERSLPSGLPDKLRPSAERMFPVAKCSVGISINTKNPVLKPAMVEVRQAMEAVVEECYSNGDQNPLIVKPLMLAARDKTMKQLFGR